MYDEATETRALDRILDDIATPPAKVDRVTDHGYAMVAIAWGTPYERAKGRRLYDRTRGMPPFTTKR